VTLTSRVSYFLVNARSSETVFAKTSWCRAINDSKADGLAPETIFAWISEDLRGRLATGIAGPLPIR